MNEQISQIGSYAFSECSALQNIDIPDSVKKIDSFAFRKCYNLTNINIGSSTEIISPLAFRKCSKLNRIYVSKYNKKYSSIDGVLFNKEKTSIIFYPANKKNKSYTIPEMVENIEDFSFDGGSYLTCMIIPKTIKKIGDYAFLNCTSLTQINVDERDLSFTLSDEEGNRETKILKGIETGNTSFSSIDGVLFNKDGTQLICCPRGKKGNYIIPYGVTDIFSAAFSDCTKLTSISIPDSVAYIGKNAFDDCKELASVKVSSN